MEGFSRKKPMAFRWIIQVALAATMLSAPLCAQELSLQTLVTPSTTILKDGRPVTFALHGFIEFKSLSEMFPYIDSQTQRWKPDGITGEQRQLLARELLRRSIESRIISMTDERPLEILITHTRDELLRALARVKEPVPPGYSEAFLAVQEKWKHSVNCWSASPLISARVLSNWYPIEEGIQLYGANYDSTEHVWQAVKYHPEITVADLVKLLGLMEQKDWKPWIARLDDDPKLYLPNAYAVEFLRHNLAPERFHWFREELARHGLQAGDRARSIQQRGAAPFRFSAFEEKVLWGDLADLVHLIYAFSQPNDPIRSTLAENHFDAVYLGERRMGFISEEFRSLNARNLEGEIPADAPLP
jgi:hypothetical protein